MNSKPTIEDSGERRQFEGGAVRDRGEFKPRPDLISPHAQMREGAILAAGAEKYDPRNWELGMPMSECVASCFRHLMKFMLGRAGEDHLAMARTNLGFAIHFEEEMKAGRMDLKWDDLPRYAATERIPQVGPDPQWREPRFNRMHSAAHNSVIAAYHTQHPKGVWRFPCPYPANADAIPSPPPVASVSTCYIAGPMRGYDKSNFPTFDLARDLWTEKGWDVISPADMDRANGIYENRTEELDAGAMREVMFRDCTAVLSLRSENGDCLVVLPGWDTSKGSAVEFALARFLGLPVIQAFDGRTIINE